MPYHLALAGEKRRIGRGIAALVLLLGGMLVFGFGFGLLAMVIEGALGLTDPFSGEVEITPVSQGMGLFALALLLPWSMLIQRWLYKVEGASLHSVRSHFRFEVFGRAFMIVLPIWTVYLTAFSALTFHTEVHWSAFDLFGSFLVVFLLAPVQSAGEEYGFRGLAFRIAASWGRGPRVALFLGVLVSSLLFMAAHAAMDPWLNVYYFVFGATLALLTWRTGGLEWAIVIHAVNNTLAFLLAVISRSDMAEGMERSAGSGSPIMLAPCVLMAAITAVVWVRSRRTGPPVTGPPPAGAPSVGPPPSGAPPQDGPAPVPGSPSAAPPGGGFPADGSAAGPRSAGFPPAGQPPAGPAYPGSPQAGPPPGEQPPAGPPQTGPLPGGQPPAGQPPVGPPRSDSPHSGPPPAGPPHNG